jgi:hypothetical protein
MSGKALLIWKTEDELKYLSGLGSWYEGYAFYREGETESERRKRLLSNYLKSIPSRVNWGDIDKLAVTDFCVRELDKEGRKHEKD